MATQDTTITEDLILNYHLMHPGSDSAPGDPNVAIEIDGIYHLHYILRHPWTCAENGHSYSFIHLTSDDMLNWAWQTTKLQPSFTGHGMFSGTGFLTKEGKVAAIYHGQASGRNQIAIAKDSALSAWEKPYPIEPKNPDGSEPDMYHWDPDCFLIGDTYYAISGGPNPPLIKSDDLKSWSVVGGFLSHEMPDAIIGEDISCPNFFPLDGKWMLLCISHPFGCRYYLGDWDADAEKFVPESHGRMCWRRPHQPLYETHYRDFFAPESLLTADGRRVMWAWLTTLHEDVNWRSVQSLPRELSLADDGTLRIRPLRELESLRRDKVTLNNITATPPNGPHSTTAFEHIAKLDSDAYEIRITVDSVEVQRKRFGVQLFADNEQGENATQGLPILLHPEYSTLRIGTTEAPFAVTDLDDGEDLEMRIFIDKYLIEVFVNNRQAALTAHMDYEAGSSFNLYSYGGPTTLKQVEIWKMSPTNQGFREALENRIWEPEMVQS